ncbi:hypothetical protein OS493_031939 [Desmophyllum pertusum]|uniref:Uncharacterized protein n=1 Tax=Desmophyllum pertusum TaxID=174260 RepID=A0A9W9ZYI7_9CNID|nr:hypothetical protein OS493_031939 [Desmophyllum pertusum]
MDGVLWNVLRVLANISLASIYRRLPKQKRTKAFQCLQNAMESGEQLKRINITIPNNVLALLDYEHARFHTEFPAVPSHTKCCNREPSKCLKLCIDRCRALSAKDQLYTTKQLFAMISLARLSLPSATRQSQPGQCHMINAEKQCCTRQAEKHLEEYERSHNCAKGSPVAARVNYLMTRSEICF